MESICEECKHRREPHRFELSPGQATKRAGLEALIEAREEAIQRAPVDQQAYDGRLDFQSKPQNYYWCDATTPCTKDFFRKLSELRKNKKIQEARELREELGQDSKALKQLIYRVLDGDRSAKQELRQRNYYDSVDGTVIKLYAICKLVNWDDQCPFFEPIQEIRNGGSA
jgi:hypothetical protein